MHGNVTTEFDVMRILRLQSRLWRCGAREDAIESATCTKLIHTRVG